MNPFYFGEDGSQLYGVLHPADGANFKDECIVLCSPFGQEYERAHRAFRNLATTLSSKGYEVLRFDYFGTGDSAGDSEAIDIDLWKQNIMTAIEEAKDCSGIDTVNLIGLRVGASMVLSIANEVEGLNRCIAWDPIVDGQNYFQEILSYLEPQYLPVINNESDKSLVYLNGYPLPAGFRQQIRALNADDIVVSENAQYVVAVSHESDEYSKMSDHLFSKNSRSQLSLFPCEADWNYSGGNGGILLPQPILTGITDLFS